MTTAERHCPILCDLEKYTCPRAGPIKQRAINDLRIPYKKSKPLIPVIQGLG